MIKKNSTINIYTDGSVSENNICKWAMWIPDFQYSKKGEFNASGANDVELAESKAIEAAVQYVLNHYNGNYIINTDSKSVLQKINGNVNCKSHNPSIGFIKRKLREIAKDPCNPTSLHIRFQHRCSNENMERVDTLASRSY